MADFEEMNGLGQEHTEPAAQEAQPEQPAGESAGSEAK